MRYDSPFIKFLEAIANMLIGTFLWFLFSLPVITVFASGAALYHCTVKGIFGESFVTDIWGLHVVDRLGEFTKPVTIIQGSDDQLVAATSIEEASHYFPNAEFHLIDGAGHGFSGDDFDTAVKYGLDYLFANT